MAEQRIQDDIQLNLQAQKVIVHETVRVSVQVQAQVDPSQSETDFRAEVQKTLHDFIDAEWKIQSVNRNKDGKYENVFVSAMARVPESENHHLSERADTVSRIGFQLRNPSVDYSLSFDDIQAINAELRLSLLTMALAECTKMNAAFREGGYRSAKYRVSSSRFDQGHNQQVNNSNVRFHPEVMVSTAAPAMMMQSIGATANTIRAQGGGAIAKSVDEDSFDAADSAPADLNVSTRFWMSGQFILRAVVDA